MILNKIKFWIIFLINKKKGVKNIGQPLIYFDLSKKLYEEWSLLKVIIINYHFLLYHYIYSNILLILYLVISIIFCIISFLH